MFTSDLPSLRCVKMHCGSAHVKGKAKQYRYYICSVFRLKRTKTRKLIWVNTGENTYPRRSPRLCSLDGKELARHKGCMFVEGYGSLHNQSFESVVRWFNCQ